MCTAPSKQRGIGFFTFILIIAVVSFFLTLGLKLGPHYMQFMTIRSVMNGLAEDPEAPAFSKAQALGMLQRRLYINEVREVKMDAFKWERIANGYKLFVTYQKMQHIIANATVLMDFHYEVEVVGE